MNKQVSRMREIYQGCQAVRIWLGKESMLTHPAARATGEDTVPLHVWTSGHLRSDLENHVSDQPYVVDE